MWVGGQGDGSAALPPGKSSDIHCTGRFVVPRAGLEKAWRRGNLLPPPGFEPRAFQPVGESSYQLRCPGRLQMEIPSNENLGITPK